MADLLVTISSEFRKEETKCEPCFVCEDIIYSNVYRLVFGIDKKMQETNIILCQSCYNAVKDKDA